MPLTPANPTVPAAPVVPFWPLHMYCVAVISVSCRTKSSLKSVPELIVTPPLEQSLKGAPLRMEILVACAGASPDSPPPQAVRMTIKKSMAARWKLLVDMWRMEDEIKLKKISMTHLERPNGVFL